VIAEELTRFVVPLRDGFSSPQGFVRLLDELGLASGDAVVGALPPAFTETVDAADGLIDASGSIGPGTKLVDIVGAVGPAVVEVLDAIARLADLVDDPNVASDVVAAFRDGVDLGDLADRLLDHLVITWLADWHPSALSGVELLGAVRRDGGAARLDLPGLLTSLQEPLATLGSVVGDDPRIVVAALERVLGMALSPAPTAIVFGEDGFAPIAPAPPVRQGLGLWLPGVGELLRLELQPTPTGVVANLSLTGSVVMLDLSPSLSLELTAGLEAVNVTLRPDGPAIDAVGQGDTGSVTLDAHPATPWVLIGSANGTRLELAGLATTVSLDDLLESPSIGAGMELRGLAVVLQAGDSDALMQALLGADPVIADMTLVAHYTETDGLVIDGALGFEVTLHLGLRLGPLTIDTVEVALGLDGTGLALDAGLGISGTIGPIAMAVEGLGISAALGPEETRIPLGDIGLGIGFKPPSGIGIGIDLGPVAGGGALFIDADAGVYEGAIQLQVLSVGVSAFVLIETKRPDVNGWSFMMALYIEIPAIQLGFGFVLTGLGGFAGINRGVDAEALGEAVRSGSMNTVLFPDDPIADAPIVIDTLASMFPAADGQYVFGPVVRFGWGTPTLVEVAVGVVIELPDPIRIAMIGTVDALLPRPEAALVELHLAVAGVVDFEAGTLAIDASLHHSKIVGFDLAGDMALRAAFKGQASFLFSLGGFHPDFEPPAGFPALRRLSIGMNAGPVFRVTFECYIAITSNTVQFGAGFEIVAKVAGFGIEGGAEFDALIQFNPFRLRTSISFYVSVTAVGFELAGLLVRGDLEGPNPWHITGYAEFRALGAKKEIDVDEIIGSRRSEIEPDPPAVLAQLVEALDLADAWAAGTSGPDAVTLAAPDRSTSTDEILVVPHGSIELGQTIVPLDETIEKFGNAEELVHDRFRLVAGTGLVVTGTVREQFAPAFFHQLKPKERLAAPSFEEMDAGLVFGGTATAGMARSAVLGYEPILLDPDLDEWLEARGTPTRLDRKTELGKTMDGVVGAIGDFEPVVGSGVFSVSDPVYEITDALTGVATAVSSSFLGASMRAGAGQVVSYAGELEMEPLG
jgi:hypothetical protein